LCCTECQKPSGGFTKFILKPDKPEYSFDDYFIIDFATGEIQINEAKSVHNQARAEATRRAYHLNKGGRPAARLGELQKFTEAGDPDLEFYSYRFFIERSV
jgi:hypothetical protein